MSDAEIIENLRIELEQAWEDRKNYLRQVEDVKCALLQNPQEEFDVGIAVDELRGQKEAAEQQVAAWKSECESQMRLYAEASAQVAAMVEALDRASYALFQIKQMMPDQIIEFASDAHSKACLTLNAIRDDFKKS